MDSPEHLKILTAELIKQDFLSLSQDNKIKRSKTLFVDLNRSNSKIQYGDKSLDLQSLLDPKTRHLLETNKVFQQLFIIDVTKKLGNFDSHLVEQAMLFLSQDLSVPCQSMLFPVLLSNPELKLEEIDTVGEGITKYIPDHVQPPSPSYGRPIYNAILNTDGTIKIVCSVTIEKIVAPNGVEYKPNNHDDNTSYLEFTVNPYDGTICVDKLTIPKIVEDYRAAQTKHIDKPKGFFTRIKDFLIRQFQKAIRLIENLSKFIFRPVSKKTIIHEPTVPPNVLLGVETDEARSRISRTVAISNSTGLEPSLTPRSVPSHH